MAKLVHLLGRSTDDQTRRLHEMLCGCDDLPFEISTRTIGPGGDFRNVPTAVVRSRDVKADLVFAWGLSALATAILSGRQKIVFVPDRFFGPRSLRWARSLINYRSNISRQVVMICPSAGQQRLAIQHGIDPHVCLVIRPGVDFGKLRRRDIKLREELGLTDADVVLVAPGESTRPSGHDQAVWAAGILHQLNPAYKLIVQGRGYRTASTMNLGARLRQNSMLVFAEPMLGRPVELEDLLPLADACLLTPGGAIPTLPVLTTMAAGVPIVSTVTYIVAELLEDRHTALMVPKRSPRSIAQRTMDLRADPALAWKIADTARAEAYEFFSKTKMISQYRQVIEQMLAGMKVELTEPQAVSV